MSVLFLLLFVMSVHNVYSDTLPIKSQRFSAHIDIAVDDSSRVHNIPGQARKPGRVTCYFTNWAVYREENASYSVDDIPYNKCTHLVYAFVGLSNSTFELTILDPWNDVENEAFNKFISLREKNPKLNVGIAMGGWGEGGLKYSQMVNDPRKRCNFTRSVTKFMQLYNFDSFDLDWEYPGASERDGIPSDKLAYLLLIRELRHSFDMVNPEWEITIAVPVAGEHVKNGYYVSELCKIVNAVHLMAYDLRTVGDYKNVTFDNADSHTPLYRRKHDKGVFKNLNVHDGVMLWVKEGCSRDKLVVGTAFYGRSFNLSDVNRTRPGEAPIDSKLGQGDPAEYTREAGYIAYFEICERLQRGNESSGEGKWARGYDEEGRVPYTYFKNNWIGYEDKESLGIKMDWIKENGFAGAMNWAIDLDDWKGKCGEKEVLIDVLSNAMENYTVPVPPPVKEVLNEKKAPISLLQNSWICYDFHGSNLTESLNLFLPE